MKPPPARSAGKRASPRHGSAPLGNLAAGADVASAMTWLERHATKKVRDGMARYGLPSDHALGVSMADMKALAKQLGVDHELAAGLWATGVYEAQMVASMVDDADLVTAAQMDAWCRNFDNWGICDTVCFKLFDRTPHAWRKVEQWAGKRDEFVKRAAFALLASLALHQKRADDAQFVRCLPLIEAAASDERNFVMKGVSWALRAIGVRNPPLRTQAMAVAQRLAASPQPSARWIGKDVVRQLGASTRAKD